MIVQFLPISPLKALFNTIWIDSNLLVIVMEDGEWISNWIIEYCKTHLPIIAILPFEAILFFFLSSVLLLKLSFGMFSTPEWINKWWMRGCIMSESTFERYCRCYLLLHLQYCTVKYMYVYMYYRVCCFCYCCRQLCKPTFSK